MNFSMTPLPSGFILGPNDVLCGRTRDCSDHIGNRRFIEIVRARCAKYKKAVSRREKSAIILDVISCVKRKSCNGGFVRYDPLMERFYLVNEKTAREKTSQAFRDVAKRSCKPNNHMKSMQVRAKEKESLSSSCARKALACKATFKPQEHAPPESSAEFVWNKNTVRDIHEHESKQFGEAVSNPRFHDFLNILVNDESDTLICKMRQAVQTDDFHQCVNQFDEFFSIPAEFSTMPSESHIFPPSRFSHKTANFEAVNCIETHTGDCGNAGDRGAISETQNWFTEIPGGCYDDPFEPLPI